MVFMVTGFIAPKGLMVVPSTAYVLMVCPGRNPRVLATTREKLLLGVSTGGPFVVVLPPVGATPVMAVPKGISPTGQDPVKTN